MDDMEFVNRVKTYHVAHADGGDGAKAEPHAIEAPFEGTNVTIDMLLKRLYDDFQAFNAAAVTAANQSATAIQASYVPLDLKTDKIERQVTRFIHGVLTLAGIDDEPSYTRNQLINKMEETQTVIMAAPYVGEDYTRKKLLTIQGDIDQYDDITAQLDAEGMARFQGAANEQSEDVTGNA